MIPSRKLALVGVFSLGALVILCAILNRVTNFTAPYGSLVYLNWYAGETATAVIVANCPHLWPLISRVFKLGSFQVSTNKGSHQYPLRSRKSGVAIPSARRTRHEIDGYIPTGSEERIAANGDKDAKWGYSKKMEGSDSSNEDLEYGAGYMTTHVRGGGEKHGAVGVVVKDEELGGWESEYDNSTASTQGQIVKSVHINQTASDH